MPESTTFTVPASTLKVPTLLRVAGRERVLADLQAWPRSQLSATEPGAAD
jgi:hypothetical protein